MAAEYEVNIKLNTKQINDELKSIDTTIKNIGKKSVSTTDQRTAAMVELRNVGDQVRKLGEQGLVVSKAELQVKKAAEALDKGNLATVKARVGIAKEEIKDAKTELTIEQKITQQLEKQQKIITGGSQGGKAPRRSSRFTDIATGAGFPLLFGGGPTQALAGGIGGAFGGLGGAIAASAVVSQIEAFVQAAALAGKAVQSTGGALDFMREKSLFSSAAVEERAAVLEELGKVEELAALLTEELTGKIGNEGVRSLQELGKTTDETTRLWSELTTQLFALISGPLNEFLKIVNQVLGGITTRGRFGAVSADFAGNKAFEAAVREKKIANSRGAQLGSLQTEDMQDLVRRAQAGEFGQVANPVQIPITAADQQQFSVKDTKAANEEQRLVKRLGKLEEERKKVLEISRFRDQIAAAEVVGDDELVTRLQGEQQIAEIEASRLKALVGVTDQREKDAINIGAATKKLAAHRDTERELNALQATRAEANKKIISGLEDQNALLQAKLDGNLEEVQLEQEIGNILEDNVGLDEKRVRSLLEARNALNEQVKVAENLDMIYDQIGQSIASGVVDTLSAAVDQTKSLADAAANTLRNIANILLQLGTNTLLASTPFSIFANLKGFADGGRPPVNRPSIVGERGPELFVPGAQGTIVPNHALGSSNIVVNVDASGSQAQGNEPNAKALGAAIGAAVQAELVKQKRPGGLLS